MNLKSHYTLVSAEERFRLILAASGRNDTTERDKLAHAAPTQNHTLSEHYPYSQAFSEISMYSFMELAEEAATYRDLLMLHSKDGAKSPSGISEESLKEMDLALVTGCQLLLKLKGWDRFCQKLEVPNRLLWQDLPGYHRLEASLELAKNWSFQPIGLLRWLNRSRPKGAPKLKRLPISSRLYARSNEQAYQERARFWGGKS